MPPALPATGADGPQGSPAKHKRTYKACLECRTAKLRCDLGNIDAPSAPPCRRCRRTGRRCEFAQSYQRYGTRESGALRGGSESLSVARPGSNSHGPSPILSPQAHTAPVTTFSPADRMPRVDAPPRLDFVYGRNLETPADALRLLCSVADDNRPGDIERPASVQDSLPSGTDPWIRWVPVREGLLTSTEASSLVNLYKVHVNICHPIIPVQLFERENLGLLLQEPLLVGTMACVAARYADLGSSFDPREPSRARVVETRLTEWILKRLSFVTMGSSALRTIGTVEAMLILSEWPPRAMLLEDTAFVPPSSEGSAKGAAACRHQDEIAWNLVGLAVRMAQGIGLHDERTYTSLDWSSWATLRRFNTWIYCMSADRNVSGRLGRNSITPTAMGTQWWETFWFMSQELTDNNYPLPRARHAWRHSRAVAEHSHLIGICQEMLYPSPEMTADLIKTGRYQSILTRLKPDLSHLWGWLTSDTLTNEPYVDERDALDPELQELLWRIDHDYVRLYANAISMRAAITRLLRQRTLRENEARQGGRSSSRGRELHFHILTSALEGAQVVEAVESATSLLQQGIECHARGVLRFCPGRNFQRIMFASVFLMKAMSFGAVAEKEPEILELQRRIITCFREAAVDEEHIAVEIANLLGRVFPVYPTAPPQLIPPVEGAGSGDAAGAEARELPAFDLGALPLPLADAPASLQQADVFANWGFDPVIILSQMDDFLQALDSTQGAMDAAPGS